MSSNSILPTFLLQNSCVVSPAQIQSADPSSDTRSEIPPLSDAIQIIEKPDLRLVIPMKIVVPRSFKIKSISDYRDCVKYCFRKDLVLNKNSKKDYEIVKQNVLCGILNTSKMNNDTKLCNEKQAKILENAYSNERLPFGIGSSNNVKESQVRIFIPYNISNEFDKDVLYIFAKVPKYI